MIQVQNALDTDQIELRRISSPDRPTIHRFFDTSPISPSGRYIALFECPFEDRLPEPGETGDVIVVELSSGETVYRRATSAWATQLGCQAQWGADDRELCFNVMAGDEPVGCIADFRAGSERIIGGPIYMVNAARRAALAPDMLRINRLQPGYGVTSALGSSTENQGASEADGVWITDLDTGEKRLLCSFAQIVEAYPEAFAGLDLAAGGLYGFHTKWNAQGTRIMFVVRYMLHGGRPGPSPSCLVTLAPDGGDIRIAVRTDEWGRGHHPNWCPDGDTIVMNLPARGIGRPTGLGKWRSRLSRLTRKLDIFRKFGLVYVSPDLRLYMTLLNYDGSDLRVVGDRVPGSGHPSMNGQMTHILTDAYPREPVAGKDGRVPLRWIRADRGTERALAWLPVIPDYLGPLSAWRVDPHPVFNPDFSSIVFNAAPEGRRQVFMCHAPTREAD